jgi:hypothetical protein
MKSRVVTGTGSGTLLGIGVAVCLAAAPAARAQSSMSVSISAAKVESRKEVDDATKTALKTKRDEASKARKALEKALKDKLGKKREAWPPEKDEELYRLEEAEALANADLEYAKIDPKAISDAVEDLSRACEGKGMQAGKKDHIAIAGSAAAADLAVEVIGRRSQKEFGAVVPSHCWVLFTIGPGGKTDPARFAKVPATYHPKNSILHAPAWRIAGPTPPKPVFTFEGYNGGGTPAGCHGAAANAASRAIDKFIEDNLATLTGK